MSFVENLSKLKELFLVELVYPTVIGTERAGILVISAPTLTGFTHWLPTVTNSSPLPPGSCVGTVSRYPPTMVGLKLEKITDQLGVVS